jgi:hypothetical protein
MAGLAAYAGGAIALLWGAAHIVPVRSIVRSFEPLTVDNRRILTMEWVSEGLTLAFLGILILAVTAAGGRAQPASRLALGLSAGALVVMAVWTRLTGARTSIAPIRICPYIKTAAAALVVAGLWL